MALTTEQQITALEDMLARGVTSAEVDGKRVRYGSLDEIRSAITYFRGKLRSEATTGNKSAFVVSRGGFVK